MVNPMAAEILRDSIPEARLHLVKQAGQLSLIINEASRYLAFAATSSG